MGFSLSSLLKGSTETVVSKPTATVGIDIGSSSVKVIEIEDTETALMLRTYGELQLGPYKDADLGTAVSLGSQKKTEAVVDVIREAQVSVKHGALAMPLSSSFLTVIPLSLKEGELIENRIPVEAKKYVPLPLSDVTLDWSELASVNNEQISVHEILLAAIENKAMTEYKELLNMIGMTGEPAEIEAFSLVRALWKQSDTTLAIIDIGAKTSKLYIIRNGSLERIHRVAVGGQHITKRVAELVGISFAEAENLKRLYTKESPQARDIYKAMSTTLEGPLREFARLIDRYQARVGMPINRIACSGGVAMSPYFISYVKDVMVHDQVEIGNPFDKVAYPAFMEDTLEQISPTFAVSLGAALRQFQ